MTDNLNLIFTDIYMLKHMLADKDKETNTLGQTIADIYNSNDGNPAMSDELWDLHERFDKALTDLEELEEQYEDTCAIACVMLDSIEDGIVSSGLHLHYICGLPWKQVSFHTGVEDIRNRCKRYLNQKGASANV